MTTLLLSGWAQPVDAIAHLVPEAVTFDYSAYPSPGEAIIALKNIPHTKCVAWSMGGQLALMAIAAGAIAPAHLTLIAAPHRFVGEGGMGAETFRLFRESYAADPARTKARFHGLIAKGDQRLRAVMELLGHHPQAEETARWLPWLDHLGSHAIDTSALANAPPTLIIHGMNDQIVPHAQSEFLARALPRATLHSWANVGHAPHLHDPARLIAHINAHRAAHGVT